MADPIYYGVGVPRGDGRLVLVLPGLFANDWYLQPLHVWLARIGYDPVPSTIWMNAGCGERLSRVAEESLGRRLQNEAKPVALIGHSGGGILAKGIAARLSQPPSHLILLASPVGVFVKNRWASLRNAPVGVPRTLSEVSIRVRNMLDPDCRAPDCECPFFDALTTDLSPKTRVTSIYTPDDPIVPGGICRVPGALNVEVSGTHTGLAFNRDVYKVLAEELSRN